MNFIFKMAWRDSRASRRRLVLFSLSVVLGIAALVAIGSLGANLERGIDEQARGLLGADLIITGRSEPSDEMLRYAAAVAMETAREISFSSMLAFPSAGNLTRLVNVRAMAGNFPFYGDFATDPPEATAKFQAGGDVVILEETLLRQFDTKVGEVVKLGNTSFTVVGALQKLPGESSAISATVAPRALIPMAALEATGLAERNVLVRHRLMLKLPAEQAAAQVESEMRQRFRAERFGYDTVAERKRDLGRVLDNIEGFLSLVGFVALFLGAIGVASAIHVYVRQKITTVAVLRCLGATAWQSFAVYLVQGLALGIFGAVAGAALGLAVQFALPQLLQEVLPFEMDMTIAWPAVLRGMGAGLVICVLFTLLPLLGVRKVSPLVALRSAAAEHVGLGRDPWRIAIVLFIVAAVVAFSISQTNRLRHGLGFAGMLIGGFAVLAGLAKVVAWAARASTRLRQAYGGQARLRQGRGGQGGQGHSEGWRARLAWRLPYVVRQGIANLYRPNNRTVLLLVSLGLGTFLMLTLFLTRTTLLKEIELTSGGGRPNLLFFDIQDDQIEPLKQVTTAEGAPVLVHAPIVTMRMAAVKGRTVDEWLRNTSGRRGREPEPPKQAEKKDADGEQMPSWALRREYRSTYRKQLEGTERLVSGTFVGTVDPGEPVIPISVEEGLFKQMGLKLGDEIVWDVQGVPMRSRVASVRAVEWRRLEPNFFVVFPAGVLEPAPKFHVAAVRTESSEHSARVQRAVVQALPSVTAIDLTLVMETVDSIFTKVALVIQFMALFTVVTGLIVLVSAVMTGRFQRIRETVLLRTLGASRRQLWQIQLVEYLILGALAAVVGCALSAAGNILLAKFIFRITPSTPGLTLLAGAAAVCIVTVITGLFTSRGIANHPPLEVLRQET